MPWDVFAASATGSSHLETGLPCQDAFAYEVAGDLLHAVVCDGAGSAAASAEGAQLLTRRVVETLARHAREVDLHALSANALRGELLPLIGSVREELRMLAESSGRELSDYAATLVGVIASEHGGWMFHVGDGVGVAQPAGGAAARVSLPENGEYANETFFVTGERWQEHLRLLPLDEPAHMVALMSDGAAPFVMNKGFAGFFPAFMDPVEKFLATASPEHGSRALATLLADPRTHSITPDDKTLLIARRRA